MRDIDQRHAYSRGNGRPHTLRILDNTFWLQWDERERMCMEDETVSSRQSSIVDSIVERDASKLMRMVNSLAWTGAAVDI